MIINVKDASKVIISMILNFQYDIQMAKFDNFMKTLQSQNKTLPRHKRK